MSNQLKKSNDIDGNEIPISARVMIKKRNGEKKIQSKCVEAINKEQNNSPTIFSKRKKLFFYHYINISPFNYYCCSFDNRAFSVWMVYEKKCSSFSPK